MLYLGAASGQVEQNPQFRVVCADYLGSTSVSHVADIVGPTGLVYVSS